MDKAIFGAGCFWGVEETFSKIEGVTATRVGYSGGHSDHPTYKMVCTGSTEHAEVVEVVFDPSIVSYEKLLDVFWEIHDPTTLNRQGPDRGSQYRSLIMFHNEAQHLAAKKSKELQQQTLARDIVTFIIPAAIFYPAEEYHQKYFRKNGGSCHL